jgi:hypothetical protein
MNITPSQKESIRKKMFSKPVLAALKNMCSSKDDMVKQFTNNRTTHIGELSFAEAVELNTYLYNLQQTPTKIYNAEDRKRKRIIALCRSIGWEVLKGDKLVADMPRINNWVATNFNAHLNELSTQQLSKVIVAAENMKASTDKAIQNATANK